MEVAFVYLLLCVPGANALVASFVQGTTRVSFIVSPMLLIGFTAKLPGVLVHCGPFQPRNEALSFAK